MTWRNHNLEIIHRISFRHSQSWSSSTDASRLPRPTVNYPFCPPNKDGNFPFSTFLASSSLLSHCNKAHSSTAFSQIPLLLHPCFHGVSPCSQGPSMAAELKYLLLLAIVFLCCLILTISFCLQLFRWMFRFWFRLRTAPSRSRQSSPLTCFDVLELMLPSLPWRIIFVSMLRIRSRLLPILSFLIAPILFSISSHFLYDFFSPCLYFYAVGLAMYCIVNLLTFGLVERCRTKLVDWRFCFLRSPISFISNLPIMTSCLDFIRSSLSIGTLKRFTNREKCFLINWWSVQESLNSTVQNLKKYKYKVTSLTLITGTTLGTAFSKRIWSWAVDLCGLYLSR